MKKELIKKARKVNKGKTTKKVMKVINNSTYVNKVTGEEIVTQEVLMEDRDANFQKIWLGHVLEALEMVGNKKVKVMMWLMSNRDVNNIIIGTQRFIATKCNVSLPVVNEAINLLIGINFMKMGTVQGTYILNPDAVFQGSKNSRLNVLLRYDKGDDFNVTETKVSENPDTFVQDTKKIIERKSINRRKELENGKIITDDEFTKKELDAKIKALQEMRSELDDV